MGTVGLIRNRYPMASLNEAERHQLRALGVLAAKEQLKMSRETYHELIDPNGVATPATVTRIRQKLAVLRGDQWQAGDSPCPVHGMDER